MWRRVSTTRPCPRQSGHGPKRPHPGYAAEEVRVQQVAHAPGLAVRYMRKVAMGVRMLTQEPDKFQIEHTEGWVGAGHLTAKLNDSKILKGITVVTSELIRVGLYAQDKTVGTSIILTANWRGTWWMKVNA